MFTSSQGLPQQMALTVDGDNITSLTAASPQEAEFTEFLPTAVAYQLLDEPDVLVVEPGGGLDILGALHHGAATVTALVENPLEAELLSGEFSERAGGIFTNPRVRVVDASPRAYLARDQGKFDLVVISLRDAFRPVTAGAYSLSENHTYTKEAFQEYFRHLFPSGVLMVTRWVQTPPSEEFRMMATVVEALEDLGVENLDNKLAMLRTIQTVTVLAKTEPFTSLELQNLRAFARSRQVDLSYLPGLEPEELNHFFVLPQEVYHTALQSLLNPQERQQFYQSQTFNVSPTTDDRPFFFHFFKWQQVPEVIADLGQAWRPFGGAGFLVLVGFLAVSVVVSTLLILIPLYGRRALRGDGGGESRGGWEQSRCTFWPLAWAFCGWKSL